MSSISLNLVVLRSADIERAAAFYEKLGLSFRSHRHGSGPEYLAAELNGSVFEIYPLAVNAPSTVVTRIGFRVESVDARLAALRDSPDAILTAAHDSE